MLAAFTEKTWLPLKTLGVRRSTRAYSKTFISLCLRNRKLRIAV
jgi:hypothetical protein